MLVRKQAQFIEVGDKVRNIRGDWTTVCHVRLAGLDLPTEKCTLVVQDPATPRRPACFRTVVWHKRTEIQVEVKA